MWVIQVSTHLLGNQNWCLNILFFKHKEFFKHKDQFLGNWVTLQYFIQMQFFNCCNPYSQKQNSIPFANSASGSLATLTTHSGRTVSWTLVSSTWCTSRVSCILGIAWTSDCSSSGPCVSGTTIFSFGIACPSECSFPPVSLGQQFSVGESHTRQNVQLLQHALPPLSLEQQFSETSSPACVSETTIFCAGIAHTSECSVTITCSAPCVSGNIFCEGIAHTSECSVTTTCSAPRVSGQQFSVWEFHALLSVQFLKHLVPPVSLVQHFSVWKWHFLGFLEQQLYFPVYVSQG